jgi:hypothetical protein
MWVSAPIGKCQRQQLEILIFPHPSERMFISPQVHHTQNPTLHPVGFFLPIPAYSLGLPRVLADFDVFAGAKNSAIFALSRPIVSATQRTQIGRSPQRKMNISIKINLLRAD